MKAKEELDYHWDEIGDLIVSNTDNLNFTLRYKPSKKVIVETFIKFRKKPVTVPKQIRQLNSKVKIRGLQRGLERLYTKGCKMMKEECKMPLESNDKKFRDLSVLLQNAYKSGAWDKASEIFSEMANILHSEEMYTDEFKSLLLSIYFGLYNCGKVPVIQRNTKERLRNSYKLAAMRFKDYEELFFNIIRPDVLPKHILTVNGFYRIVSYCLLELDSKVDKVLKHLSV